MILFTQLLNQQKEQCWKERILSLSTTVNAAHFDCYKQPARPLKSMGVMRQGLPDPLRCIPKGEGRRCAPGQLEGEQNQHRILQCHSTLLPQRSPHGVPREVAECHQVAEVC